MRKLGFVLLILCCTTFCLARSKERTILKVKIEAPELDKVNLLKELNYEAKRQWSKITFEAVDQDFEYRIVYGTGQREPGNTVVLKSGSVAVTDVYDKEGKELFRFNLERSDTDKGNTEEAAQEIFKRLMKWRKISAKAK